MVDDNLSEENDVIGLYLDADNVLYALTGNKVWQIPAGGGNMVSYTLPCRYNASCMAEIGGKLYIGTEGDGVYTFSFDTKSFTKQFMPGNGVVTSLSATGDGSLMVSTDGEGIFFYSLADGRPLDNYTASKMSPRQLRSNSVYSALSDDEGRLWIGYYQSGLDYTPYDGEVVRVYDSEMLGNYPDIPLRAFSVADDERYVLAGTPEGVLLKNQQTGEIRNYHKPEIDSNLIFAATYLNGKFFVGSYHGGMYMVDPASGRISKFGPEELAYASIFKLEPDRHGNLWAGTSEGLYIFEGGNPAAIKKFTSKNSQLPPGNVYEIFFDSTGRGWICTENGIAVWNGDHLRTSGFPSGFVDGMKIRTIYEDSAHNLYFAPDRGEVWKSDLSLKNFGPLKIGVGDRFSQITSIIEDDFGAIWMGTDKGLVKYEGEGRYEIFNSAGGHHNQAYTLSKPIKDREGVIWMGATNGLHYINPVNARKYEDRIHKLKLHFTSVRSNGNTVSDHITEENGKLNLSLGREEKDFTVNVSDFSYRYLNSLELEYMLEGVDEDWQWTDASHSIEYRDVPSGSHTLRVREAGNPDSEIQLEITKSNMAVMWGWIIAGILILAGILTALSLVMAAKKRKAEAARKEAEREMEAEAAAEEPAGKRQAEYRTTRLSDEECRRLYKKLENLMKNEKPYLNVELKSKDLAAMVGTSSHALSFLFNQYLNKSYYDYVNQYRVEEFKRMVKESDISKYTLSTLAERCGFSSRASFFRHFKAATGQTPAEYLGK